MKLTSKAFIDNGTIPVKYTGEGQDITPPLEWSEVPKECHEFVLICEDPDAPKRKGKEHPFVHWVIYNISPSVSLIPEGLPLNDRIDVPIRADQGKNSFGKIGYGGPLPPVGHGVHRYIFTLYSLDTELAVPPGASKAELEKAMQGHILDSVGLTGKYERKSKEKVA